MENNKFLLLIAIVAGVFATALAFTYIQNTTSNIQSEKEPLERVLKVKLDLPAGHVIDPDKDLSDEFVPARTFASFVKGLVKADEKESMRGTVLGRPVPAGAFLTYADAATIPDMNLAPGTRAIGIKVKPQNLMGGLLVPGDRVDIVATYRIPSQTNKGNAPAIDTSNPQAAIGAIFSKMADQTAYPDEFKSMEILSNVRVIGIGGSMGSSRQQFMFTGDSTSGGGDKVITLEVTSEQAVELIQAAAASKDTLTLLLRPESRLAAGSSQGG